MQTIIVRRLIKIREIIFCFVRLLTQIHFFQRRFANAGEATPFHIRKKIMDEGSSALEHAHRSCGGHASAVRPHRHHARTHRRHCQGAKEANRGNQNLVM